MVLVDSKGVPRVPSYLGYNFIWSCFRLQDFHLLWCSIPAASSNIYIWFNIVPQPSINLEFRLVPFRSPLLRESLLLSFPLVTKMFQFTRFALSSLFNSRSSSRSFLIRVFSDQNLLPVPRNISLVATPFIASEHQGIRRKLLIAWLVLKVQIFQVFTIQNFLFVEISGFEPLTSAVQKQRSTNWAIPPSLY